MKELELPKHITRKLMKLPETGMGYQKVDLILRNHTIIKNVIVLNASTIETDKNIDVEQVVDVKLCSSG
jgi:hypothetical protein